MSGISWLHLSDWHQKGQEFDRKIVRDALIKDIETRSKIDPALTNIDFVVFSGDVTYSGKQDEFQTAITEFFNPVLNTVGLGPDRLIIVPGNHDLEWSVLDLLPTNLLEKFDSSAKVTEWLTDSRKRRALLEPMAKYSQFVREYLGENSISDPAFGYVRQFNINSQKIAIIGLNSAWLCGQYKEKRGTEFSVNDYEHLILGESQVYDLLQSNTFKTSDIRIAVMHHPFDWLKEFDRQIVRDQLRKNCHFILHGHEHQPEVRAESGAGGECTIIPAGPSYDRREPEISRCANAYNYVVLDFKSSKCKVYLRRYEDRQGWIKDTGTTGDNKSGIWQINLHRDLRRKREKSKLASKKVVSSRLENAILLYLATCHERDQFAKLDQAGETDPDKSTLLKQVFVDLEIKTYGELLPKKLRRQKNLMEEQDLTLATE